MPYMLYCVFLLVSFCYIAAAVECAWTVCTRSQRGVKLANEDNLLKSEFTKYMDKLELGNCLLRAPKIAEYNKN